MLAHNFLITLTRFCVLCMLLVEGQLAHGGKLLAPLDAVAVDNTYKSATAGPARIRFVNYCTVAVDLYWIDYSGNRQFYARIPSATMYQQDTLITHPWLIVESGTGGTNAQGTGNRIVGFLAQGGAGYADDFDVADICPIFPGTPTFYQGPTPSASIGESAAISLLVDRAGGSLQFNAVDSSNSQEFKIKSHNCPAWLLIAAACNIEIEFRPTSIGSRSSTIQVWTSSFQSPHRFTINGTGLAPPPMADSKAVEFYHANFDHYFVSTDADEIGKLDRGDFTGWSRTGRVFGTFASSVAQSTPVCRFYIPPAFGDSHFYSASPAECEDVRVRFPNFAYEKQAALYVYPANPATGGCPSNSDPVYRLWNHRPDTNHRYVTDRATRDYFISRGYAAEGYGPAGIAFCAPKVPTALRVLSTVHIPIVPGTLDPNGSYRVRWVAANGVTTETFAIARLGQTLETIVPWIPGANPSDIGGGFSGTYTAITTAGSPVLPAVSVNVSALPIVSPPELGYYTSLLGAVTAELLNLSQGQPFANATTIAGLTGASSDAYLYLLNSGSAAEIELSDRVAKAILETITDQTIDSPIPKASGQSYWGSPAVVVKARSLANALREFSAGYARDLGIAGAVFEVASVGLGIAAFGTIGSTLVLAGTCMAVAGLVVSAGYNIAAASMVGKVTDADLVPIAQSFANFGIKKAIDTFNKSVGIGQALCGSGAAGVACGKIYGYASGRVLKAGAEISGWADSNATAVQREFDGIEQLITPDLASRASSAPRPTAGDYGAIRDCPKPPPGSCSVP